MFTQFDRDRDGLLEVDVLGPLIRSMGPSYNPAESELEDLRFNFLDEGKLRSCGSRGPGGRPPLPPRFFFKSCSFQAILKGKTRNLSKLWAHGPPPWGQNSTGPP